MMYITAFPQVEGIGFNRLVRGREGLGLREIVEVTSLRVLPSLLTTLRGKDLPLDVPPRMHAVVKPLKSLCVIHVPVQHEVSPSFGERLDVGLLGITVHLSIKFSFNI